MRVSAWVFRTHPGRYDLGAIGWNARNSAIRADPSVARDLIRAVAMQSSETFDAEGLHDPDRAQPRAGASESSDYFVFRLRGRTYAVSPARIELVVPMQPIVTVPTVGTHVRGVIHMRGRVIAVIDLAGLLGIDDQPPLDETARLIICSTPCPFAFVAEATLGIWSLAGDLTTRRADDGPLVGGRIEDRGSAATLIDTHAVIERVMSLRTERP
jgi:purine-binding chemotaxis protein CheW